MKKAVYLILFLLIGSVLFAQQNVSASQKFALVIGNSNYTGISQLRNPVNDANDMEAALRALGFTVEKVLDGTLEQMENAVLNLGRRLTASRNSYGFFFFAGHGVQSNGENFLIPVVADNIRSEAQLRDRAVSLQFILNSLGDAGNELNMIVLDACRDNPFGWARSGSRGLSVVSQAPSGTIIMYATGANSTADDGIGRNGLFTEQLLNSLRTPGLSVLEVFNRTGNDVIRVSGGRQHPEISIRFFGSAYLGSRPDPSAPPAAVLQPVPPPPALGRIAGLSFEGDIPGVRERHTITAGLRQAMEAWNIDLELNENAASNTGHGFSINIFFSQTPSGLLEAEATITFLRNGRVLHQNSPYIIRETNETLIARRIAEELRRDQAFFNRVNNAIR